MVISGGYCIEEGDRAFSSDERDGIYSFLDLNGNNSMRSSDYVRFGNSMRSGNSSTHLIRARTRDCDLLECLYLRILEIAPDTGMNYSLPRLQ